MVQTVKRMVIRSTDPHLALLSYRATPLAWCNLSPAELLMGRRIRTPVPQSDQQLIPKWPYHGVKNFRKQNELFKRRQTQDFDRRHRMCDLPPIPASIKVWISSRGESRSGKVISPIDMPRSYLVKNAIWYHSKESQAPQHHS